MKNIIHLENVYLAPDHIALKLRALECDLRYYLCFRRQPKQLNAILVKMIEGIQQLHKLGYVHRDLKPDNVVLSLDPLDVRLIDFNRFYPLTQSTLGHVRGTPGYFPTKDMWRDGSTKWDIWAVAAIILECDMDSDSYRSCKDEADTKRRLKKLLLNNNVCKHLKLIMKEVIMIDDDSKMMGLDTIKDIVKDIKFKSYKSDDQE